jgi:adenine-specific DNA-methyltransferase
LLTESGSVFVQIGDENVHLVRSLLDEVFGADNHVSLITLRKTAGQDERLLNNVADYVLWFAKNKASAKFRALYFLRSLTLQDLGQYGQIELGDGARRELTRDDFDSRGHLQTTGRPFQMIVATSSGHGGNKPYPVNFAGSTYHPTANRHWSTHPEGFQRLITANRIALGGETLRYVRFFDDFVGQTTNNIWTDIGGATDKTYVVETATTAIQRCLLMTTDPGDLVLDPTCGSGTTAYVAEQWGRRWITIDTSRVALALARTRLMAARYPQFLLKDSAAGMSKEAQLNGQVPQTPLPTTRNDVKQGFVYERVPHVTLKSIAQNPDIHEGMSREEIDPAIARHAETEILYDRPYEDPKVLRVSGPFTVESLSPHRVMRDGPEDDSAARVAPIEDATNYVNTIRQSPQGRRPEHRQGRASRLRPPRFMARRLRPGRRRLHGERAIEDGRRGARAAVRHRRPRTDSGRRQGSGSVRRPSRRLRLRVRSDRQAMRRRSSVG